MSWNWVTDGWLITLKWHLSMQYTFVCIAEISGNSSKIASKAKQTSGWYGNIPTVLYKYFSRFGKPSVLKPVWNRIGISSHQSFLSLGCGWFQSPWLPSWKSTSAHLSTIGCSDGSKSFTVNSMVDRTVLTTFGVGDNVCCLPSGSDVGAAMVGGITWSASSSSEISPSVCLRQH